MTGDKCDVCLPNHYGFSDSGCTKCECDPDGSANLQCNELGQCECRPQVSGDKCDRCSENFYNFTVGCQRCDECYSLVQTSVNQLRANMSRLNSELDRESLTVASRAKEVTELEAKLRRVKSNVNKLHSDMYKPNTPRTYNETLVELRKSVEGLSKELAKNSKRLDQFEGRVNTELAPLGSTLKSTLDKLQLQLTMLQVMQSQQQGNIETITKEYETEFESIKAKYPNLERMRDLAGEAREEAQRQQALAKEFDEKVTVHTRDAKEAVLVLNGLLAKLELMASESVANSLEYDVLVKSARDMIEQSELLKEKMDKQVQEAKRVNADLAKFNMPSYDTEIQRANERINDINNIVSFV